MNLSDEIKSERTAFAEGLSEYNDQRKWYSSRASDLKTKSQRIEIAIIASGALVAALAAFLGKAAVVVALLGALVAILQGAQRVYRYSEIWPEYRRASERMKRERRMFEQGIAPYDREEDEVRSLYVAALEAIIAEEQKLFFSGVEASTKRAKKGGS
jgi:hypothetical protein